MASSSARNAFPRPKLVATPETQASKAFMRMTPQPMRVVVGFQLPFVETHTSAVDVTRVKAVIPYKGFSTICAS